MKQMDTEVVLPEAQGLFYGGAWHESAGGASVDVLSPAIGKTLHYDLEELLAFTQDTNTHIRVRPA